MTSATDSASSYSPETTCWKMTEKATHDRVNLARLVRRLEKTVATESWADDAPGTPSSTPAWIRTRGTLQVCFKLPEAAPFYLANDAIHRKLSTPASCCRACNLRTRRARECCGVQAEMQASRVHIRCFSDAARRYDDLRRTLDRLESLVLEVDKVVSAYRASSALFSI